MNSSTFSDHNVDDMLGMIAAMDIFNHEQICFQVEEILLPYSLLPKMNDVENEVNENSSSDFPSNIDLPTGVDIAENLLDRITIHLPFAKMSSYLMSNDLIAWGVVRRQDTKAVAFQFLMKKQPEAEEKSTGQTHRQRFHSTATFTHHLAYLEKHVSGVSRGSVLVDQFRGPSDVRVPYLKIAYATKNLIHVNPKTGVMNNSAATFTPLQQQEGRTPGQGQGATTVTKTPGLPISILSPTSEILIANQTEEEADV